MIKLKDHTYCMYYLGFSSNGVMQIGMEISEDGIIWEKHNDNPVVTAGMIPDGHSVWFFALLNVDNTLDLFVETITAPGGIPVRFSVSIYQVKSGRV